MLHGNIEKRVRAIVPTIEAVNISRSDALLTQWRVTNGGVAYGGVRFTQRGVWKAALEHLLEAAQIAERKVTAEIPSARLQTIHKAKHEGGTVHCIKSDPIHYLSLDCQSPEAAWINAAECLDKLLVAYRTRLLSAEQRCVLLAALGLDSAVRPVPHPSTTGRNTFAASPGSPDLDVAQSLVNRGFMKPDISFDARRVPFYVTEEGWKALRIMAGEV